MKSEPLAEFAIAVPSEFPFFVAALPSNTVIPPCQFSQFQMLERISVMETKINLQLALGERTQNR